MAFTKTPATSTYSTERIPAAYSLDIRPNPIDGTDSDFSVYTQDAGMINLVPMKYKNPISKTEEIHAVTRNAIHGYSIPTSGLPLRGCYVWEKSVGLVYYFAVVFGSVYTSTDGITWAAVDTIDLNHTPVRFTEFISSTNVKKLVMVTGSQGWVYTSNAAGTKIVAADFPTDHVPFPVVLDGYLFLAKRGTGDIYNSNLDDPALWTAGDFISSELYPDDVQALVKINNYLLAIGTQGCEYFYDAANPTASPLARQEGSSLPFGTQIPNSIASNKDSVIFIANNNDGENTIKAVKEFKAADIDSGSILPMLSYRLNPSTPNPSTAGAVRGFLFRQQGKLFYGLSFQGDDVTPVIQNGTFVYSFDTGYWTEFKYGQNGTYPFPVYFSTNSTSKVNATYVGGHVLGVPFVGRMEEGTNYPPFSPIATDAFYNNDVAMSSIYVEIRTPTLSFDTLNRKTMSRLGIIATTSWSTDAANVMVRWIDWDGLDYQTQNSVAPKYISVAGSNGFPFTTQLGAFRQRAFILSYDGSAFIRFKGLEMDINKGQQ